MRWTESRNLALEVFETAFTRRCPKGDRSVKSPTKAEEGTACVSGLAVNN